MKYAMIFYHAVHIDAKRSAIPACVESVTSKSQFDVTVVKQVR